MSLYLHTAREQVLPVAITLHMAGYDADAGRTADSRDTGWGLSVQLEGDRGCYLKRWEECQGDSWDRGWERGGGGQETTTHTTHTHTHTHTHQISSPAYCPLILPVTVWISLRANVNNNISAVTQLTGSRRTGTKRQSGSVLKTT